ncbi:MAG: metal ABC transporter ATP-binding protein [Acetivibrionales bacterium]|jgi:zinc transport system ATP-binding protein
MEPVIEIKNLSVYYGSICALSNINLSVYERDFLGIMGPNGGGKSTLLKTVLGLQKPTEGSVKIFGQTPGKTYTPIGYVPQFSIFDKDFPISVEEVVLMGRLKGKNCLFHRYSAEDRKIANGLMKELEVYSLRNRQIGQLSGGQLQRVLIARALAVQPIILLLDEPTASLDTESKSGIYKILKELNKRITIIVVTHDMGAVSSYIKTLCCLNGMLHYHGEPKITDDTIKKVYGCPIDLIAHGIPHRVLDIHKEEKNA